MIHSRSQCVERTLAAKLSHYTWKDFWDAGGMWGGDSIDPGIGPVFEGRLTTPLSLYYNNTSALSGLESRLVRDHLDAVFLNAVGCDGERKRAGYTSFCHIGVIISNLPLYS